MTIQCPITITVTAPAPTVQYAASDGSTPPGTPVCYNPSYDPIQLTCTILSSGIRSDGRMGYNVRKPDGGTMNTIPSSLIIGACTVTAPAPQYAASDGSTPPGTPVCILSSTADSSTKVYGMNEAGTILGWIGTFYVAVTVANNISWFCYPNELKLGAC